MCSRWQLACTSRDRLALATSSSSTLPIFVPQVFKFTLVCSSARTHVFTLVIIQYSMANIQDQTGHLVTVLLRMLVPRYRRFLNHGPLLTTVPTLLLPFYTTQQSSLWIHLLLNAVHVMLNIALNKSLSSHCSR